MDRTCSTCGRQGLGGRTDGERPLVKPTHRWEDSIKMDLQEVVWRIWTGLNWLRIETGGGHL